MHYLMPKIKIPKRTLDAGNPSRGGGLLSSLLSLVGLEHSNSLIHLKQDHREWTTAQRAFTWYSFRKRLAIRLALREREQTFFKWLLGTSNSFATNWPLSAATPGTRACGEVQSCQFPAAYQWSCQPGWGACSGSGGTDAHLKEEQQLTIAFNNRMNVSNNALCSLVPCTSVSRVCTDPASASVPEEGQQPAWRLSGALVLGHGQQARFEWRDK